MLRRVIAIGDIHGCAIALRKLVELINPQPDDTLIQLGDCIDRGPDSRQVIEEMLALRKRCRLVSLLGNHEEMMLNYLDGKPQPDNWLLCGGNATLRSYGQNPRSERVPAEHLEYIRTWADFYETGRHFFVHGAYHPEQPFDSQRWQMWRWHSLREMVPAPHVSGKVAVVGHTSLKDGEILDLGHLICIDTYCWGGGWLTALDTTSGQVWQVNREGRSRHDNESRQPAKPD
ncbi:MAG TPA: metallophosphoesterase family protein [Lacipirellulaceae bacterium]|nr:metallophosphoesterase family protein [Lacipirellulaceae bacterium]